MERSGLAMTVVSHPPPTSVTVVAPSEIESGSVRNVIEIWDEWIGVAPIPPRTALSLSTLGRAARQISLARVLHESEDYEFRIIGDEHLDAYGANYQGRAITDVMRDAPFFGKQLKTCYDRVSKSAKPFALRGIVGADLPNARFSWFETVFLPFGHDKVDHIMNVASYRLKSPLDTWVAENRSPNSGYSASP